MRQRRIDLTLMLLLFASNVLLRLWLVAPTRFDGLYGQDPYAYYNFAEELIRFGQTGQAPGPFFWPIGYPALLAIAFIVFGQSAFTGQLVSIVIGALLPVVVYQLFQQIQGIYPTVKSGRETGLSNHRNIAQTPSPVSIGGISAALMMSVCGQALQSSVVIMADVAALFWVAVSAMALLKTIETNQRKWLVNCGVTLALAVITRWLCLFFAPIWGLALIAYWRRHIRWKDCLIAGGIAGIVFVPQFAYSHTNPNPTLNHAWVMGWSPENALRHEFTNIDGHFLYADQNAQFYARVYFDTVYVSPMFTPLLILGLCIYLWHKRVIAAIVLCGWAFVPILFLIGIPYQNIRFGLIVFPAVAMLVGAGVFTTIRLLFRLGRARFAGYIVLALYVSLGLRDGLEAGVQLSQTFITNQQRDKETVAWANTLIPNAAEVYTFGLTLTLQHYTDMAVYELYYETPDTLAEKGTSGEPAYLLINVWNVENQWVGREPQIAFHWLRDTRGLTEMGRKNNYTLFRIGA